MLSMIGHPSGDIPLMMDVRQSESGHLPMAAGASMPTRELAPFA